MKICPKCRGHRHVIVPIAPTVYTEATCEVCQGTGLDPTDPEISLKSSSGQCPRCLGKKRVQDRSTEIDCPVCVSPCLSLYQRPMD